MKVLRRKVLPIAILTLVFLQCVVGGLPPKPALGSDSERIWFSDEWISYKEFTEPGPIIIDGMVSYITGQGGVDDFIYPAANIYVVEDGDVSGSSKVKLNDVGGTPNTVISEMSGGYFMGETIGNAGYNGIVNGAYDIVIDECEDGYFDPGTDYILGPGDQVAFRVKLGEDVPPLPQEIQAVKDAAGRQELEWMATNLLMKGMWKLYDKYGGSPINDIIDKIVWVLNNVGGMGLTDVKEGFMTTLANMISHYRGIKADPPDQQFQQPVSLAGTSNRVESTDDQLLQKLAGLENSLAQEGALSQALLSAMEKYQGAQQAKDGYWALTHAKEVMNYSTMLAEQMGITKDNLTDVRQTVNPLGLDQVQAGLVEFQTQVRERGFSYEERQQLYGMGLTDAQLEKLRSDFLKESFEFKQSDLLNKLDDLIALYQTEAPKYLALAKAMNSIVEGLQVTDKPPVVSAGGPYTAGAGETVAFKSTTTEQGTLTYAWDVDGSGKFINGNQASLNYVYKGPFDGFAGVKLTNAAGKIALAYSRVKINDPNQAPSLSSLSPEQKTVSVVPGQQLAFHGTASDPDGINSLQWLLDGKPVGTGEDYVYLPQDNALGLHEVTFKAEDGHSANGVSSFTWQVAVAKPVQIPKATPAIISQQATNITLSSATLSADFTLGDADSAQLAWQYREQGQTTWQQTAGNRYTQNGKHSEGVSGLLQGKTYEYRLMLTHAEGTIYGDAQTFTTQSAGQVQLAAETFTVNENSGNATIKITRTNGTVGTIGVQVETKDGSAVQGQDYTVTKAIVSFAEGETEKSLNIPITNDSAIEGDESFELNLTSPTGGAVLGSPVKATVNIIDDDLQQPVVEGIAAGAGWPADTVNAINRQEVNISGTTAKQTGAKALITISDGTNQLTVSTPVADDGSFRVTGLDFGQGNPAPLQEGTLTVTAVIENVHGIKSPVSLAKTLTYDATPPVLAAMTPAADGVYQQISQMVVNLSEGGSGIDVGTTEVSLLGPDDKEIASDLSWSNGNKTLTIKPQQTLADGAYQLELAVKDSAQNILLLSKSVQVDSTPALLTATPAGGFYATAQTVALTSDEPAEIYYTLDGSEPGVNSDRYVSPLSISQSLILKYIAIDRVGNISPVNVETYVIDALPPVVSADPPGGIYRTAQSVQLTANETADIFYTLDGSEPGPSTAKYAQPIPISSDTILKYMAVDQVGNQSPVSSSKYVIDPNVITTKVYTTDQDFDAGNAVGVEHTTVDNQLQLSKENVTFPFIWIPSNDGTVSKINTDTGAEVGRYRIAPPNFPEGGSPSRTTVDLYGNCWIGCRDAGTVVKIGLTEAGQWVDRNGNGVLDTSKDVNGDGYITGDEILPWGQDEAVLYEIVLVPGHEGKYVPGTYPGPYDNNHWGTSPRGLAVDSKNNLWAATWSSEKFYYINGDTGEIEKVVDVSPWNHTSYGAVLDPNGVLWSSGAGGANILRLDPNVNPPAIKRIEMGHYVYGMGLGRQGYLYASGWENSALSKVDILTGTKLWTKTNGPRLYQSRGVAVTEDNDVWVVSSYYNRVTRFDPEGNEKASIQVGSTPTGVAVDSNGKIWVCDNGDEYIYRIDPTTNKIDFTKAIKGSRGHYSYSDMTGIVARSISNRIGTWSTVYDSEADNTVWTKLAWSSSEPEGTAITVKVRSSNDKINWSQAETVSNGNKLSSTPKGRYLEITVALQGDTTTTPILYDISVSRVNTPPVAEGCQISTDEDTPVNISLQGNDQEQTDLTYTVVTPPVHGKLQGQNQNLTYVPDPNYNGTDSFTYQVSDGSLDSGISAVDILVNPVNDPPVVGNDSKNTNENTALTIPATELLANDSDIDGDTLTLTAVRANEDIHGSVILLEGAVVYTPDQNYFGPASFTYTISDGQDGEAQAVVSINVQRVNDPPAALDQEVACNEDSSLQILLTGNDPEGYQLTYTIVTQPKNGSIGINGSKVEYTPNPNYNGTDSFTYKVNDGQLDSNIATVAIKVNPINDPPVAKDKALTVPYNGVLEFQLEASDIEGDSLSYVVTENPTHGVVTALGGNRFKYQPENGYSGKDSFSYKVNDGKADSNIAKVTITVEANSVVAQVQQHLPITGTDVYWLIPLGLAVIALGVGLSRRKRSQH